MKRRSILTLAALALLPSIAKAGDLTGGNYIPGAFSSANGYANAVLGSYDWASGYGHQVNGNFNNVFGFTNGTIAGNSGSILINGAYNSIGGYANTVFGNFNSSSNAAIGSLLVGFQNTVSTSQTFVFGSFFNGNAGGCVLFSDGNPFSIRSATALRAAPAANTFTGVFNGGYFLRTNDGQGTNPDAGLFLKPSAANTVSVSNTAFVGINTASPTAALDVVGNINLPITSVGGARGVISAGGTRLIHTVGFGNFFAGPNAGNLTSTAVNNTAVGDSALLSNTTGVGNTASGSVALTANTTGNGNTATGRNALTSNNTGAANTATGSGALTANTTGNANTALGATALNSNTTGSNNTAIGQDADVSTGALTNATAIGSGAIVDASNKVRIGNASVTVIQGQVAFTAVSDRTKKENFRPVDPAGVLQRLRGVEVTSWNYIGQDAAQFRHYGPMAQDFHAAFGQDAVGAIGTPTTINSGDMDGVLLAALQGLAREKDAEIAALKQQLAEQAAAIKKLASVQDAKERAMEERLARLEAAGKDRAARALPATLKLVAK